MDIIAVSTPEQVQQVEEIAFVTWNDTFSGLIPDEQIAYMLHHFQSFSVIWDSVNTDSLYYLIVKDDDAVGYFCLVPEGERMFLSKIYILPDHQRKGYAENALHFIKGICTSRNADILYLTVNRGNTKAISFYLKHGFVIAMDKVKDIGNGFVMDDHIMELSLR